MKSKYGSFRRQKAFLHLENSTKGQQDGKHLLGSEACQLLLEASPVIVEQLLEVFSEPPATPLSSPPDLI